MTKVFKDIVKDAQKKINEDVYRQCQLPNSPCNLQLKLGT